MDSLRFNASHIKHRRYDYRHMGDHSKCRGSGANCWACAVKPHIKR